MGEEVNVSAGGVREGQQGQEADYGDVKGAGRDWFCGGGWEEHRIKGISCQDTDFSSAQNNVFPFLFS